MSNPGIQDQGSRSLQGRTDNVHCFFSRYICQFSEVWATDLNKASSSRRPASHRAKKTTTEVGATKKVIVCGAKILGKRQQQGGKHTALPLKATDIMKIAWGGGMSDGEAKQKVNTKRLKG